jgi:hypothetical protein
LDYFGTLKPTFPAEYCKAFSAGPQLTTTTFRTFIKDLRESEIKYLDSNGLKY